MKVLFVSSGRQGDTGYVVKNQGESLIRHGVDVVFFTAGPGILRYLKAVRVLRREFREGGYSLVHAHYSLCAFAATLAGCRPLVVSLMGSDTHHSAIISSVIRFLSHRRWGATIVKTAEMQTRMRLPEAAVIPNGVDTERFRPVDRHTARRELGLDPGKKLVLFVAGLNREEKRLWLAEEAVKRLHDDEVVLLHLHDTPNERVPLYLSAADLLLLTSSREGSVNVVKEAMACNCPVVSTDVGDVRWLLGSTEGCFITSSDPSDIAESIRSALDAGKRTGGRNRIEELGLDAGSVAERIIRLYKNVSTPGEDEGSDK
jgi:glycosyltransferase involved in cell wall biosynthesis